MSLFRGLARIHKKKCKQLFLKMQYVGENLGQFWNIYMKTIFHNVWLSLSLIIINTPKKTWFLITPNNSVYWYAFVRQLFSNIHIVYMQCKSPSNRRIWSYLLQVSYVTHNNIISLKPNTACLYCSVISISHYSMTNIKWLNEIITWLTLSVSR